MEKQTKQISATADAGKKDGDVENAAVEMSATKNSKITSPEVTRRGAQLTKSPTKAVSKQQSKSQTEAVTKSGSNLKLKPAILKTQPKGLLIKSDKTKHQTDEDSATSNTKVTSPIVTRRKIHKVTFQTDTVEKSGCTIDPNPVFPKSNSPKKLSICKDTIKLTNTFKNAAIEDGENEDADVDEDEDVASKNAAIENVPIQLDTFPATKSIAKSDNNRTPNLALEEETKQNNAIGDSIVHDDALTKASLQDGTNAQSGAVKQSNNIRKPNPAIQEAKRRWRLLKVQEVITQKSSVGDAAIGYVATESPIMERGVFNCSKYDAIQDAMNPKFMELGETGIIYDETISEQRHCDIYHAERIKRCIGVLERCRQLHLLSRCKLIPSRKATKDEILLLHSAQNYDMLMPSWSLDDNGDTTENTCETNFASPTFDLSLLATGCTIDLVKYIVHGTLQNGMAIIQQPGSKCYGYFNNVAIAAKYALEYLELKRIMIVDWDVHHAQCIQRFFYHDPRVLYFSIHRFELGQFDPNHKVLDYDQIGFGRGQGYNFNLPLYKIGMGNGDYMAIFQQLLIPVAIEYQPEIIIVSAGYDAALGCPIGEMEVTPAFFPHLLHPLLKLAQSRIAVVLEGGTCLDSVSESAALTLRALLGEPCPIVVEHLEPPCPEVQTAILNCMYANRPYWLCLQVQPEYTVEELNVVNPQWSLQKISYDLLPLRPRFTREAPNQSEEVTESNTKRLQFLKAETRLFTPNIAVCYVYDKVMLQHKNMFTENHPETPSRIERVYDIHNQFNLLQRMHLLPSRIGTIKEICLAHTKAHVDFIRQIDDKVELDTLSALFDSVYFHPKSYECAALAVGLVLQVVDEVLNNEARSGVCIVRPPGHHAEADKPHGFCIFNNIAIAAEYAIGKYGLKRVLIVDWDVHHGNGTQHAFESNPQVLYISVHRYDYGNFFPHSFDANFNVVGKDMGLGFNVNIPWNKKGMGNMEYVLAFQQLIMPIAYEFRPELVLVSAGFDAAIGDPIGSCEVTPEAYGLFTHWLMALAQGRIILCLEGGYNLNSTAYSMMQCTKSLLGDPLPVVPKSPCSPLRALLHHSCVDTLRNCLNIQQNFWNSLVYNKHVPNFKTVSNDNDSIASILHNLERLSKEATKLAATINNMA